MCGRVEEGSGGEGEEQDPNREERNVYMLGNKQLVISWMIETENPIRKHPNLAFHNVTLSRNLQAPPLPLPTFSLLFLSSQHIMLIPTHYTSHHPLFMSLQNPFFILNPLNLFNIFPLFSPYQNLPLTRYQPSSLVLTHRPIFNIRMFQEQKLGFVL